MSLPTLSFGLPSSLGKEAVRERARAFADVLYDAGFSTVVPTRNYDELEAMLRDGELDAAWGPPLVCGRLEQDGARVLLRAVRNGKTTYCSALIARSDDVVNSLEQLANPPRPLRAAWVDQASTAGYLLARALLRQNSIDPQQAFDAEETLGSHQHCVDAVLDRTADITATFAPVDRADDQRWAGFIALAGGRSDELQTIAFTDEVPNDGLVLSPALPAERIEALARLLTHLASGSPSSKAFARTFAADRFDTPPPGTYISVLELL